MNAAAIVLAFATALAVAASDRSIVDLQPFRQASSVALQGGGAATLIDLNPRVGDWYLLSLRVPGSDAPVWYHIENRHPETQSLALDARASGIRIVAEARSFDCALWDATGASALAQARDSGLPYAPICSDRLYLRNPVAGRYTRIERITNFLRDRVWGGDEIVTFVRSTFFRDAYVERAEPRPDGAAETAHGVSDVPRAASTNPAFAAESVNPPNLGIDVGAFASLRVGAWYSVVDAPGIFVSVIEPRAIDAAILDSYPTVVGRLDSVESEALDYLVAMDLAQFDVAFALGTDHPRVGWSERSLESVRDPNLPGPDGIDSVAPLVVNGLVNPAAVGRTAATFTGGFKREHGAFRYGPLAQQNRGSHYGFIEHGAVFSTLQPGLATLYVTENGAVQMATWDREDDAMLEQIRYARQNGVPIIDEDRRAHTSMPGAFVSRWGPGNWSGSTDERLRTLRAGVCLQQTDSTRYLIYGYFSTATPSAMARVFQAYGCSYAMHLDMNALEHTYFALYTRGAGKLVVHHLIDGMSQVDRKGGSGLAPRFLSFPDDRDFFYLTRKSAAP